ncbi:hypothetical protein JZ751_000451, partial [Albula glossodonta]
MKPAMAFLFPGSRLGTARYLSNPEQWIRVFANAAVKACHPSLSASHARNIYHRKFITGVSPGAAGGPAGHGDRDPPERSLRKERSLTQERSLKLSSSEDDM